MFEVKQCIPVPCCLRAQLAFAGSCVAPANLHPGLPAAFGPVFVSISGQNGSLLLLLHDYKAMTFSEQYFAWRRIPLDNLHIRDGAGLDTRC